jgi:hypothetical protein
MIGPHSALPGSAFPGLALPGSGHPGFGLLGYYSLRSMIASKVGSPKSAFSDLHL